jgi:integration host factor subunit beta
MTKTELVTRLHDRIPQLALRDAEIIVATIFTEITTALARGDRVELRGFGVFSVRRREAGRRRNPRTGAHVNVTEKYHAAFKMSTALIGRLNAQVNHGAH